MDKGKGFGNRLDIKGFPNDPTDLTKQDWIDLFYTVKDWAERVAKRHKSDNPQTNSGRKNTQAG